MNIESVKSEQALNSAKSSTFLKGRGDQKQLHADEKVKQRQDKLELSDEARNFQVIKSKVAAGTYNKPEIIRDVAMKLSKEIPPQSNTAQ